MTDGVESIRIQYTQTFTVHPPDEVEDEYDAEFFVENELGATLWDAIDVDHGEVEILEIND